SSLVDKLVIGVLKNNSKKPLFTVTERVKMLKEVTKSMSNIEVEAFDGLLIDFAHLKKANIIVRGLRAVTDFEYELQIAQINHKLSPDIDTIFFTTSVDYAYLSSSVVKEIAMYNGNIEELVPGEIVQKVYEKYKKLE